MDTKPPIDDVFATEEEVRREVHVPHFGPVDYSEEHAKYNYKGELQCRASVPDGGRSPLFHQCSRRGVIEEGGYWWCRQHHPTTQKRKRIERDRQWQREWQARREQDERQAALRSAEREIITLARGCLKQEARYDDLMTAVERYEALLAD